MLSNKIFISSVIFFFFISTSNAQIIGFEINGGFGLIRNVSKLTNLNFTFHPNYHFALGFLTTREKTRLNFNTSIGMSNYIFKWKIAQNPEIPKLEPFAGVNRS